MRPDSVPRTQRSAQPEESRPEEGRPQTAWPATDTPATERRTSRAATASVPTTFTDRALVTASGTRQPVVAILLAIVVVTVMAGKPLDGLLLAVVTIALAWDAGMSARHSGAAARSDDVDNARGSVERSAWAGGTAWPPRAGRPRRRHITLGVAGALVYSLTIGSFTRMSWPATAGVIGLGAGAVIIGWGGPTRRREIPSRFTKVGILAWGSLSLAACLWELAALLGQPNFEQSSYTHPTISTLTDPLLSTSPGRTIALLAWIGLGAFLVER